MDIFRRLFSSEPQEKPEQTDNAAQTNQKASSEGLAVGSQKEKADVAEPKQPEPSDTQEVDETDAADDVSTIIPEPLNNGDTSDLQEAGGETDESLSALELGQVTRPLEAPPSSQSPTSHLMFGQASDTGMIRENNQDAVLSFFSTVKTVDEQPDFGVFIVADGMGGHTHGERASAIATRVVAIEMMNVLYLPMMQSENINDADRPTISEALIQSVQNANQKILESVEGSDQQTGTTVTALVILDDWAHLAHVGDSRAYMITTEGAIEQITRDHSLVQRLIELGQLQPEEAEEHPKRNVLYRAVGQTEDLEVDTLSRRLQPGNSILICSDGLWGLVEEDELKNIIVNTPDPQEACEKLVALANTKGGSDNITAIILKVPSS